MALTPPPQNPPGHDHRTPEAIYGFDARGVAKRFRHAAIFGALDSLHPGEVMRFVNDHTPSPCWARCRRATARRCASNTASARPRAW